MNSKTKIKQAAAKVKTKAAVRVPSRRKRESGVLGTNLPNTQFRELAVRWGNPTNPDAGVLIDPFEHIETNQYLRKTDTTRFTVQAKSAVTFEELSTRKQGGKLTAKAVHRLHWSPPMVVVKKDSESYVDARGVFSDLDQMHLKFTNVLSQPIVVTLNSPRSSLNYLDQISFRDFEKRLDIPAGKSMGLTVNWRDLSNVKAPTLSVLPLATLPGPGQSYDNLLVFEVLDYMVEYPNVDRESNTNYVSTTEVCRLDTVMHYVVNHNFPPDTTVENRNNFVVVGSDDPDLDLFGIVGTSVVRTVPTKVGSPRIGDNGEPKWVGLDETTRPFLAMVRHGGSVDYGLQLVGCEADFSNSLPIALKLYASEQYRLWVPGLGVTAQLDPHPETGHCWKVRTLFGFDHRTKAWFIWDEHTDTPLGVSTSSKYDDNNDQQLVPSTVQGLLIQLRQPGRNCRQLEIDLADILGFLDSVTHVVGIVSAVVGLFA